MSVTLFVGAAMLQIQSSRTQARAGNRQNDFGRESVLKTPPNPAGSAH